MAPYFAACRARIPDFARTVFSLRGSLVLHRQALGWDLARAPLNLVLTPLQVARVAAAAILGWLGAGRVSQRLRRRSMLLETDTAREIARRIRRELLRLPDVASQDDDDAIAAAIRAYVGTRPALSEVAAGLMTALLGALTLNQLTPGALTLGPLLASAVARQEAIAAFPLGATFGGLWYGWFPPATPWPLLAATTAGLLATIALATVVAGILLDPLQLAIGLHQRRLHRLVNALERHAADTNAGGFRSRDHYAARALDLVDLIASAHRLTPL